MDEENKSRSKKAQRIGQNTLGICFTFLIV